MIKRPLHPRFSDAVLAGRKTTTIRPKPWPTKKRCPACNGQGGDGGPDVCHECEGAGEIPVPIMLYNWSGLPYRSKQVDVAAVICTGTKPLRIERHEPPKFICPDGYSTSGITPDGLRYSVNGITSYAFGLLWRNEGFESQADMDEWFLKLVKPGQHIDQHIMGFRLL